ncbi:hypothetical protein [Neptunomonas marina]|uniref:Uncharacterized protein n=1 Tax=Neptunomonas marina TaxID=1815562 RepID=A0A437Q4J5_9GAMM|nr:hypothetical protein [Neptunomonas marina]RVU29430.1 hypothetical protein EOE65_15930 [Neptunomonas marina]
MSNCQKWIIKNIIGILLFLTLPAWGAYEPAPVRVSENGKGSVLIFPFYTTENGWDTYINVLGGMDRYSLRSSPILHMKVRSPETGDVTDAFNIYLKKHENFRASISANAEGKFILRVAEGTCVIDGNRDITSAHYGGVGTEFALENSLGSIELYVTNNYLDFSDESEWKSDSDCSDFMNSWRSGSWASDSSSGVLSALEQPEMQGKANLVNVGKGLASEYLSTALVNTEIDLPHLKASNTILDLSQVKGGENTYGGGIQAVIGALEKHDISNEVVVLDEINAKTDWVITYPLAGYANYKPFEFISNGKTKYCDSFYATPKEGSPSVVSSRWAWPHAFVSFGNGVQSENFFYQDMVDFSSIPPAPEESISLNVCNAVNVLAFDSSESIVTNPTSEYLEYMNGVVVNPVSTVTWSYSSPYILGFRLTTFENGTLNGGNTLANYSLLSKHNYE